MRGKILWFCIIFYVRPLLIVFPSLSVSGWNYTVTGSIVTLSNIMLVITGVNYNLTDVVNDRIELSDFNNRGFVTNVITFFCNALPQSPLVVLPSHAVISWNYTTTITIEALIISSTPKRNYSTLISAVFECLKNYTPIQILVSYPHCVCFRIPRCVCTMYN